MDERSEEARAAELLAHARWIRRLARGLLADAAAADDVVQETMLVALRGPWRPTSSWLAEVARNLARERWRSDAWRRERELRAARPEAQPDASAPLERLERQRELADAVRALAEPYRTTVLLRYMDGLSCARIARRQGVPAATVRSRLKRGLAELRARLGGSDAEERRAFALGLVALSAGERATTWTGGAALAMQAGTKLGLAAALFLAGSVGLWMGLRERGSASDNGGRDDVASEPHVARAEEPEVGRSREPRDEQRARVAARGEPAPPAAEPSPEPEAARLEPLREELRLTAEATLDGALDPAALVGAALRLLEFEVATRPLPEPRDGALRYPLLGTPEGLTAELLVRSTDHSEHASPILSLSVRVEPPNEPYVLQGSARRDAEVTLTVLRDVEGEPSTLSLRTTFESAPDPSDRLAHLRSGTFLRGLHASFDAGQASAWTVRAEGLRMTGGTPERGAFDTTPWEVPLTLVGDAWAGPRAADQVAALNAALIAKHEAIQAGG